MPFWLDHKPGREISAATPSPGRSRQVGCGRIPAQDRIGCGYVYSDKFTTPDQAKAEIEEHARPSESSRNDPRFDSGRLDNVWIGNCIALGLSSSFLEPLEATSIHGTIVQVMLLRELLFKQGDGRYEKRRATTTIASLRSSAISAPSSICTTPANARSRSGSTRGGTACTMRPAKLLELWSNACPSGRNSSPFPTISCICNEQLVLHPVVDGLGHLNRAAAKAHMETYPKSACPRPQGQRRASSATSRRRTESRYTRSSSIPPRQDRRVPLGRRSPTQAGRERLTGPYRLRRLSCALRTIVMDTVAQSG